MWSFDPAPSSDEEAGMQVTQCHWKPASWGFTADKRCHALLSPSDHKPSFQVSGKLLKYEDALGVTEGIISNPGIPQNVGISSCDHDLNLSPHLFPCWVLANHLSLCCRKKLARPDDLLQPVSLGAHKAEINEWWLGRESGNRTAAILGSHCQSRS